MEGGEEAFEEVSALVRARVFSERKSINFRGYRSIDRRVERNYFVVEAFNKEVDIVLSEEGTVSERRSGRDGG